MRVNAYLTVTGILFAAIAGLNSLRLIYEWPVLIGPLQVPALVSWVAAPLGLALCLWSIVLLRRRS